MNLTQDKVSGTPAWAAAGHGGTPAREQTRALRRPVLEAVRAQHFLVLQVGADLGGLLVRQPFGDQRPPDRGAGGADNRFVFNFAVARRTGDDWQAIAPDQVRLPMDARRRLAAMWQRIWTAPNQDRAPAGPEPTKALLSPDGSG